MKPAKGQFSWDPAANLAGASYEGHTEPVSGDPPQILIAGVGNEKAGCGGTAKPSVNLFRRGGSGEPAYVMVATGSTTFECEQCVANITGP